ncbi:MAG TPA: hypothetical protein VGH19_01905 [Verrucomicrobiae bacterium]
MKTILTILLALAGLSALAQTAPARVAAPRTQISLAPAPDRGMTVSVAGTKYVLPQEMSSLDKAAKAAGFTVSIVTAKPPYELRINSLTHEVVIDAAGFEGWGSKVDLGAACQIIPDFSRQIIDLATPAANTNAVVLRFHDGGKASMSGGSTLRYDEFKDRSYYVSGNGKVDAENADGQTMQLFSFVPPMTGGPLVEETGADGGKRTKRLSPLIMARGAGELLEKVQIGMAQFQWEFEKEGQKTVSLTNGTTAVIYMSPDRTALRWRVTKGYIRFGMEQIRCWQAQILTDQKADFQWDSTNLMVDTHNNSDSDIFPANRDILCTLSRSITSSTGPGGTFQYALLDDCDKFVGSGYGNDVHIYNMRTGKGFELANGNVQFRNGSPVTSSSGGQKPEVKLAWNDGSALQVGSAAGSVAVEPGGKQTLTLDGHGELNINYSGSGVVGVDSVSGEYTLLPKILQDWKFEIGADDSVVFTLDTQKGVFTVHSKIGNNNPVNVGSPDGFNPVLYPDSTLTFVLAPTGLTLGRTDGTIIFYEAAGTGTISGQGPTPPTASPGGTLPPSFGSTIGGIDPTLLRVEQAPVSNFN